MCDFFFIVSFAIWGKAVRKMKTAKALKLPFLGMKFSHRRWSFFLFADDMNEYENELFFSSFLFDKDSFISLAFCFFMLISFYAHRRRISKSVFTFLYRRSQKKNLLFEFREVNKTKSAASHNLWVKIV